MKLYLVHCGFYNETWGRGIFENHTNFFVVAENPVAARTQVKNSAEAKNHRMHIDGVIEIQQVDGYRVTLEKTTSDDTQLISVMDRELAPKKNSEPLGST